MIRKYFIYVGVGVGAECHCQSRSVPWGGQIPFPWFAVGFTIFHVLSEIFTSPDDIKREVPPFSHLRLVSNPNTSSTTFASPIDCPPIPDHDIAKCPFRSSIWLPLRRAHPDLSRSCSMSAHHYMLRPLRLEHSQEVDRPHCACILPSQHELQRRSLLECSRRYQ